MDVIVTGSSGLIGSALVRSLRADGHTVVRLVRDTGGGPDTAPWDPLSGSVRPGALEGADAVVHLAGAGIGDRPLTAAHKRRVYDSRILGTRTIARAVVEANVGTLVCGSAVGYYGDTGERTVDETGAQGEGFLSGLVRDWEAETRPAEEAGVRVAHARSGIVLDGRKGLLAKVLPLFRLGLGGRLGSGRQWMSWISLHDEVAALRQLLDGEVSGAVNLTAPNPVTNAGFTAGVGRAVHRPAKLAVPAFALRAALRGLADEGALVSQRVLPARLEAAGFTFAHPGLDEALRAVMADRRGPPD